MDINYNLLTRLYMGSSGPADPETCLMHSPVVHGQNGRYHLVII